jgi:hypothetical protein
VSILFSCDNVPVFIPLLQFFKSFAVLFVLSINTQLVRNMSY